MTAINRKLYPDKYQKPVKAPCGAKIVKAKLNSRCANYGECKQFTECLDLVSTMNWKGFKREKDV